MADYWPAETGAPARQTFVSRLLSLHTGAMLWRNTVVSCSVFVVGLGVLWALVDGRDSPRCPRR